MIGKVEITLYVQSKEAYQGNYGVFAQWEATPPSPRRARVTATAGRRPRAKRKGKKSGDGAGAL